MKISTILCTHNPRPPYLERTLAGLRAQSCPRTAWELLLVDNASSEPLAPRFDLCWHPHGRHVSEPTVGLTAARLRGIAEARGEVLVFVDDDNVLASDYLERALALADGRPQLGVWGCGAYSPEWEQPPAAELAPYLDYLAVRTVAEDRVSSRRYDYAAMPAGAGLCVRAGIARRYAADVQADPRRRLLGRTGTQLSGCEDFDLGLTAIDLGYAIGVFRDLAMVHLMPRRRVEEDYLLKLVEGHAYSTVMLMALRGDQPERLRRGPLAWVREQRLRRSLGTVKRRIHDARRAGAAQAFLQLRAMEKTLR